MYLLLCSCSSCPSVLWYLSCGSPSVLRYSARSCLHFTTPTEDTHVTLLNAGRGWPDSLWPIHPGNHHSFSIRHVATALLGFCLGVSPGLSVLPNWTFSLLPSSAAFMTLFGHFRVPERPLHQWRHPSPTATSKVRDRHAGLGQLSSL